MVVERHLPRPHLYKCGRGRCPFHDHICQYVVVEGGKFFSSARQKPFHFPPTFTLICIISFTFTSSLHLFTTSRLHSYFLSSRPLSSLSFLSPPPSLLPLLPLALRPPPSAALSPPVLFFFLFFFFFLLMSE